MKRLFTLLVVLVLVGFAVFKAGVWWLADQRLADARSALASWGALERGSISSGIEGRLVLSGSRWQDFRLTQPLAIGRVEFIAGSPVDLLTVLADPSSLPATWTLQAEGLGLILEATMFRNWVTADGENEEGAPALFALSCAPDPRQQLGSGDLMRMGVTGLGGELLLRQEPEGLYGELNTAGTGSLEFTWPGARFGFPVPEALSESTTEPLRATVRDSGLMRRVAAYCSRESGLQPAAWAARAVDSLQQGLRAQGLEGSDQLLALYRQWLLEGGELRVSVDPGAQAWGIPVYSGPDPGPGWEVEYNGGSVPGVYLLEAPRVAREPEKTPVEPPASREAPDVQGWFPDNVENAGHWVGRRVRVTLANDKVVEGRLVRVGAQELEVAREIAGGEVAYPMLIRAIARFEVWRRGRTQ